ncbi:retinol dehydrogenase 12-like [Dorcoceras hygrometricum]|uniref:Retinol dehydrogenase 12-like n=1 Tax=Dorcoceras hygrometricum TaxID=472368 RepID=A0A2Z6ZYH6_9LAMI|nr:retinol dehydrogenase 12-like [Dorcoceras hygrometricum]
MRIRPPELETSICDAKYHVSLRMKQTAKTNGEGRIINLSSVAHVLYSYKKGIRFDKINDIKR